MTAAEGAGARRLLRPAPVLLAATALVAGLAPRVTSLPGVPTPSVPLAPEQAVRVRRGDVTLVYDKRRSWVVAKSVELYPNAVCTLVPADQVERSGVVHETSPAWTFPWWRAGDE